MAEIGETRRYEPNPSIRILPRNLRGGVEGDIDPVDSGHARKAPGSTAPTFGRPAMKRGVPADPLLGQKVRHPEYSVGAVVGVEGEDEDRRLSVSFPGRGTKKSVERYAQLQQV